MFQDHIVVQQRHQKFVRNVCENETVYTLECAEGFATSSSNEYEDNDGEPITIFCFWSKKALAKSCIKDDWSDYKIIEIPLSELIEDWCIGLYNDGLIIGTDFDSNMFGYEVDPADLVLELIKELKDQKKEIKLIKYSDLTDLENQIIKSRY